MNILAIDPGPTKTAWAVIDPDTLKILGMMIEPNEAFVLRIIDRGKRFKASEACVIEYPQPRGQPMYTQLVDTIRWIGRFEQAYGQDLIKMDRQEVKYVLCGSMKARDSNIRAAILSKYHDDNCLGGGKQPEVGTKKNPGPLYGVSKDLWAALAVALTYAEKRKRLNTLLS